MVESGKCAILLAAGGLVTLMSHAQAESWKFDVDPAVTAGRPAVIAKASSATTESLRLTIFSIAGETSQVLAEKEIAPAAEIRCEAPAVDAPTFIEMAFASGATSSTEPLFRWRTVALPKGRRLIDYHGRRDFLPPPDFDTRRGSLEPKPPSFP